MPIRIDPVPAVSLVKEKYQVAQAAAMMN